MIFVWLLALIHIVYTWLSALCRGRVARTRIWPQFVLNATPLISVLIPAWNERSVLAGTLSALQKSDYPDWEAIIVAGGPDGTEGYARELTAGSPNLYVIGQPPRGKNAALNLGLAQARGDMLVILDADIRVAPNWLSLLVAPLTNDFVAATPNYFPSQQTWVSSIFEMQKISAYQVGNSTSLHGGGFVVRREIVDQIGRFPEDVTVGIDWDFDQRVNALGLPKVFIPQARHSTPLAHTLRDYLRDETRWRRAHLQITLRLAKSRSGPEFLRSLVPLIFYGVALAFWAAIIALLFLPYLHFAISQLALIFCLWVLLRRIALALECYTVTRDTVWLRRLWIPPLLLIVDFVISLAALLTLRRQIMFFKGPRPQ